MVTSDAEITDAREVAVKSEPPRESNEISPSFKPYQPVTTGTFTLGRHNDLVVS